MTGKNYLASLANPTEYQRKLAAWEKAAPIPGYDPVVVRIDCDGRIIFWSEYGLRSDYGWQIDHIIPVALNGSDGLFNLRARHWLGNCTAGGYLGNAMNVARERY
jgi:hypothetical protein